MTIFAKAHTTMRSLSLVVLLITLILYILTSLLIMLSKVELSSITGVEMNYIIPIYPK